MLRTPNDARHAGSGAAPRWAVTPDGLDPRNVLAAERTFLAWIRTSLTLLATGAAVSSLPLLPDRRLRALAGLVCVAAAALVAVMAHLQWRGWSAAAASHGLPRPRRTALLLISVVLVVTTALTGAIGVRVMATHRTQYFSRHPGLRRARP